MLRIKGNESIDRGMVSQEFFMNNLIRKTIKEVRDKQRIFMPCGKGMIEKPFGNCFPIQVGRV